MLHMRYINGTGPWINDKYARLNFLSFTILLSGQLVVRPQIVCAPIHPRIYL